MKYHTFCFSKRSYDMCLREHERAFQQDIHIVPYWITYYAPDGDIIRGCDSNYIAELLQKYKYDENQKRKDLNDYFRFISDPDAYSEIN